MSKIYFDTEFEGLFDNAKIISIGLINDTGKKSFYAELSNTYKIENCSEFCQKVVLPLLEHNNVMTIESLRVKLYSWLKSQGQITLVCDSPKDIIQVNYLFPNGLPKNCHIKNMNVVERLQRKWYKSHIYEKHKLRHHHALDDAIANRLIFNDN